MITEHFGAPFVDTISLTLSSLRTLLTLMTLKTLKNLMTLMTIMTILTSIAEYENVTHPISALKFQ